MLISERLQSIRWALLGGLTGASLVLCAGCPTGSRTTDVLRQLVAAANLSTGNTGVTIRIVNKSNGLNEQLDVNVDGALQTYSCTAADEVCNFPLASIPNLVQAAEERRYDTNNVYRGGRVFSNQNGFTFSSDQLQAGSIIVFRLSETTAEAFVL